LAASDKVVLHLDKPLYVTGESLNFRLSVPPEICPDEALVQTYLIDNTGTALASFYIQMTKGNGYGSYDISYDLKPGVYQLLAVATNKLSRLPIRLIQVPISIYDDLAETQDLLGVEERPAISDHGLSQTLLVTTGQKSYHPGDTVTVTVKAPGSTDGTPSSFSLVLRDRSLFEGIGTTIFTARASLDWRLDPLIWLWGTITKNGSKSGRTQLVAFMPEQGIIEYTLADSDGRFLLPLQPFDGSRDLQLISLQRAGYKIKLDAPPLNKDRLGGTLVVNDRILAYLELSRRRKKLLQIFPQPIPETKEKTLLESDWQPDRAIVVKEYDQFDNLLEFFSEINTALKLRYRKDNYRVKMVNPDRKPFHPGTPVFIVDNIIYYDPIKALTLDIRTVQRIDLYYKTATLSKHFGQLGNNGVVVLNTNNNTPTSYEQDRLNLFTLNGLQSKESIAEKELIHGPIFSPMAYWNPMVVTKEGGEAQFKIPLTDDVSNFEIEVIGYSLDGKVTTGVLQLPVTPR